MAHELGHWKDMDIYYNGIWDIVFMTICGWFFQRCLNNPHLLMAFGFQQESIFISIYLFYKVYSCTLDYPQRKMFNVLYRKNEYKADRHAVDLCGLSAIKYALLRNYSVNLDALFKDRWYAILNMSHPTLLERLGAIERHAAHTDNDYRKTNIQ